MKAKWKIQPAGPRVVKTAIAVMLSVLLVRQFASDTLSVFYAGFGALIAMDTTFSKSLMQGLTQLIGVLAGTVVGYLSVLLYPAGTPAWMAGLGVLLLIILCNTLKLSFSASLACMIFLSVCLDTTDNILRDSLFRLRDTSVGVGIALAVNVTIRPYNNKKRILLLLTRLLEQVPPDIAQIVSYQGFPDWEKNILLLRRIDRELSLYHSQRFFHRKNDDEALLRGCYQLAERIVQELEVICGMDTRANLSPENAAFMRELGIPLPQTDPLPEDSSLDETIVMNYHLEKLLSAYKYLSELTQE